MKSAFLFLICCFVIQVAFSQNPNNSGTKFSFAFLTDIHLNKDNYAKSDEGLKQAMDKANQCKIDFFLTGGDNADIDGLNGKLDTADSLYNRFHRIITSTKTPVYPCLGNHDRFWGNTSQKQYHGSGLFEKYFGNPYYSFNHKDVHFIVLNSIESDPKNGYCVGPQQKQWLADDLKKLDSITPVVVAMHVPMLSMYYPAVEGKFSSADVISNFKEIWDMFKGYNLQMVLQGHQHLDEKIYSKGTWFITGGAVCASWWGGSFHDTEEGFLLVNVDENNKFSFEYIDYGWTVPEKK